MDRELLLKVHSLLKGFYRDELHAQSEYMGLQELAYELADSSDARVSAFGVKLKKAVRRIIDDEIRHGRRFGKLLKELEG